VASSCSHGASIVVKKRLTWALEERVGSPARAAGHVQREQQEVCEVRQAAAAAAAQVN
jgi:hypothetical protein